MEKQEYKLTADDLNLLKGYEDYSIQEGYKNDQSGYKSLIGKAYDSMIPDQKALLGDLPSVDEIKKNPADALRLIGLKYDPENANTWDKYTDNEKRAAISIATMALPGGWGAKLIQKIGIGPAMGVFGKILGWGAEGAAVGAGTHAAGNYVTDRPLQEGLGRAALQGAGTAAVLTAAGGSAIPQTSAAANRLMDAGVPLTIGQAADRKAGYIGNQVANMEEGFTSVPFAGTKIQQLRSEGDAAFNDATINRVNPQGAPELVKGGVRDEIGQLEDNFSNLYGEAYDNIGQVPISSLQQWNIETLKRIRDAIGISKENKKFLADEFSKQVNMYVRNGPDGKYIDGADLGKIRSSMSSLSRTMQNKTGKLSSAEEREVGALSGSIVGDTDRIISSLSPESGNILKEVNAKYPYLKVMQGAADRAATRGGEPTPNQILMELRSSRHGRLQNPAPPGSMQEWLESGSEALTRRTPDSGTPGRIGLMSGIGAVMPGLPLWALYNKNIQNALVGEMRNGYTGTALKNLMSSGGSEAATEHTWSLLDR